MCRHRLWWKLSERVRSCGGGGIDGGRISTGSIHPPAGRRTLVVAIYRLTVRGRLGPQTLGQLDDLTVERQGDRSVYVIEVVDQVDLYGVIQVFQSAGVELVSIAEVELGG